MNFIIKVPVEECPYMRKKAIVMCKHPSKTIYDCCIASSSFYEACPLAGCIERTQLYDVQLCETADGSMINQKTRGNLK